MLIKEAVLVIYWCFSASHAPSETGSTESVLSADLTFKIKHCFHSL